MSFSLVLSNPVDLYIVVIGLKTGRTVSNLSLTSDIFSLYGRRKTARDSSEESTVGLANLFESIQKTVGVTVMETAVGPGVECDNCSFMICTLIYYDSAGQPCHHLGHPTARHPPLHPPVGIYRYHLHLIQSLQHNGLQYFGRNN